VGADGASDRKDSTSLRRETAALRDFGSADDGFGNFYASRPVAMCPGEGLLTEPTAATQIVTAATALHALEPSFREAPRGNADAIVAHLHQLQVLASHLGNFMRTLVMPQGGGVGGADQRAREADQDRREDREPQLLSHIPDGSGYRGRCSPKSCRRLPASRRSSASSSLASDPALFMPTQVTPGAGQDTASLRLGRVNGLVRSPSVGLTCDNLLPRISQGAILALQRTGTWENVG